MTTPDIDDRIAWPGDPDLDCHLAGLRLTSVISPGPGRFDVEAVLTFDTADAGGFPDSPDGLTISFGSDMTPGYEELADHLLGQLHEWADEGAFIEMTAAPGKFTLMRSRDRAVVIVRSGEPGQG